MTLLLRLMTPAAVLFCFIEPIQADSESSRIGQLIEALDDVHLPQRMTPVHPPADDAGDLLGELVGGTRRRQSDPVAGPVEA